MSKIFTRGKIQSKRAQKLLSIVVSLSLMAGMVSLGRRNFVAEAEVLQGITNETPLHPNDLDATGGDKTKWKQDADGGYVTQNQGQNSTPCTMRVLVEVQTAYAELQFDWKVSSQAGYDWLTYTLTDDNAANEVVKTHRRYGKETAYSSAKIKLPAGNYTLNFSYKGDGSNGVTATCTDTGYVKDLKLVTYSGVSTIPYTLFATADDLKNGEIFSLAEKNDDKVGRVVFGTRPNSAKYIFDWYGNQREVAAGPITWLIAGWDEAENSKKPGLVLYAEEPMFSVNRLIYSGDSHEPTEGGTDSRFQIDPTDKKYIPDEDSSNPSANEVDVSSSHWGASKLRAQLKILLETPGWFTDSERSHMLPSSVETMEYYRSIPPYPSYITVDTLYALVSRYDDRDCPTVAAGETKNLIIDPAYCGSSSWLRSPTTGASCDVCVQVFQKGYVVNADVDANNVAAEPAFKLDLDSIIFASAATADSGEQFSQIASDVPMYLRLDGSTELAGAAVAANGTQLTYTAPAGSRLMVIATTEDGATYQFSHNVDTGVTDETLDLVEVAGELEGKTVTAKAWIEKDADGQLTYATNPTNISATMVRVEEPEISETPDELEKFPEIQGPASDFEEIPNTSTEEKSTDTLKTGDKTSYFAISALCLTTGSALSVVLGLRAIRKKFRE